MKKKKKDRKLVDVTPSEIRESSKQRLVTLYNFFVFPLLSPPFYWWVSHQRASRRICRKIICATLSFILRLWKRQSQGKTQQDFEKNNYLSRIFILATEFERLCKLKIYIIWSGCRFFTLKIYELHQNLMVHPWWMSSIIKSFKRMLECHKHIQWAFPK